MILSPYQEFIALSRYARYNYELGRRETWEETVDRLVAFWRKRMPKLSEDILNKIKDYVYNMKVMPSMRSLMTAGPALERSEVSAYNCAAASISGKGEQVELWDDKLSELGFDAPIKIKLHSPIVFDEAFYILLNGTGFGFSVERQFVADMPTVGKKLSRSIYAKNNKNYPKVPKHELSSFDKKSNTIFVADSKEGWASALRIFVVEMYNGNFTVKVDTSAVRPAGAPLKVFGGRSSGAQALLDMLEHLRPIFIAANGRKLTSIEAHDVMCHIASAVICGGVRRCLDKTSMVNTPRGFRQVGELEIGDEVQVGGKTAKVLAYEDTGEKSVLKIKHMFGEVTCTPEHTVFIFDSTNHKKLVEVPAAELKPGDCLAWDAYGYDGVSTKLPSFDEELHFNAKEIKVPELGADVAWLIGVIMGDGHIAPRCIEITADNFQLAILDKANKIFARFGLTGNISAGHGACSRLRVFSTALARWFKQHVKVLGNSMRVPSFIMNGTREVRAAFLAGIFDTDGRYRKQDNVLEQVTSISAEFVHDVKYLLLSLGMASVLHYVSNQRRRDAGENANDAISLNVRGMTSRRAWHNLVAKHTVSEKYAATGEFGGVTDFKFMASMFGSVKGFEKNDFICVETAKKKGLISDEIDFLPSPIVEIAAAGEVETCDIEVEGINAFVAEGVLVHNSAMLSLSNLSDDRMRSAKSGEWWIDNAQRSLANNSVAYTEKPEIGAFMREWQALYDSKAGERGVFNRVAAQKAAAATGRDAKQVQLLNPCCFAGDMCLLTDKGYVAFSDLVNTAFNVISYDGQAHPGKVWEVGKREVVKLTLAGVGPLDYIVCTADHMFMAADGTSVMAKDLAGITLKGAFLSEADPTVVAVEDAGSSVVYDFFEPATHWGNVNGVVVHNCEIALRDAQFCNLSLAVVREEDTLETLRDKVAMATLLGTMQATLTDFAYLSPIWKQNCEEERLIGVSMCGYKDHPILCDVTEESARWLRELSSVVISENKKWAAEFGINPAAASRCQAPNGTSSQLIGAASGMHERFSRYYLRRVRADEKDPLARVMQQQGYPCEPDVMQKNTLVFSFPVKSPETAKLVGDTSAIQQLEFWMHVKKNWCDSHNPSITVYVKEHEWMEVGAWVYKNFDDVCGISFLPHSNHVYKQAPYEAITKEQYEKLVAKLPQGIDYEALMKLETEDYTTSSQEYACSAGACELV